MNLDEFFGILKEEDAIEDEIIDEIFKKDEEQIEEVLEREPSIEDCLEDIEDTLDNVWVLVSLIRKSEESDEVLNDLADTTENLINSTEELLKKARGI